jgi:hypothetical protein
VLTHLTVSFLKICAPVDHVAVTLLGGDGGATVEAAALPLAETRRNRSFPGPGGRANGVCHAPARSLLRNEIGNRRKRLGSPHMRETRRGLSMSAFAPISSASPPGPDVGGTSPERGLMTHSSH